MVAVRDTEKIIAYFYAKFKGENSLKLWHRINERYTGISQRVIQSWINSNEEHCLQNPIFSNWEELQPIVAIEPMERLQVDLVTMESVPSIYFRCLFPDLSFYDHLRKRILPKSGIYWKIYFVCSETLKSCRVKNWNMLISVLRIFYND